MFLLVFRSALAEASPQGHRVALPVGSGTQIARPKLHRMHKLGNNQSFNTWLVTQASRGENPRSPELSLSSVRDASQREHRTQQVTACLRSTGRLPPARSTPEVRRRLRPAGRRCGEGPV